MARITYRISVLVDGIEQWADARSAWGDAAIEDLTENLLKPAIEVGERLDRTSSYR